MRVHRPRGGGEKSTGRRLLWGIGRAEIILASALLILGGFVLRAGGGYDFIVIGGVLLALGGVHLYQLSRAKDDSTTGAATPLERMVVKLRSKLTPNYTLAVRYPISTPDDEQARLDLLVLGPGGVFAVKLLPLRGVLEGRAGDSTWTHRPPEDSGAESRTVSNPLPELERNLRQLRNRLAPFTDRCEPEGWVVLTYHQVEGSALFCDRVCRFGELPDKIRRWEGTDRALSLEVIPELEDALSVEEYD